MAVGLFKLVCGDVIISAYDETPTKYVLRNPFALSVLGRMSPWLIADASRNPVYEIEKVNVMLGPVEPRKDVMSIYVQQTTGLVAPAPGQAAGPGGPAGNIPPTRGGNVPPTRGGLM